MPVGAPWNCSRFVCPYGFHEDVLDSVYVPILRYCCTGIQYFALEITLIILGRTDASRQNSATTNAHSMSYRQRHLLRTAYFARGWQLIDRPKPSTCSYLPCSYLTIRLPPRCSGCLFLFQYSMLTCPIMLCSTVCCAVQQ